jgi:hypothetical protein
MLGRPADADTGTGTDAGQQTGHPADADHGAGGDLTGAVGLASADTGTGAMAQAIGLAGSDAAAGLEFWGIVAHLFDLDSGADTEFGFVPGLIQFVSDSDAGTGAQGYAIGLRLSDAGTGASTEAVPGQSLDVGDFDSGHGVDGLWYTWGTGWGAIIFDLQIVAAQISQDAAGEAQLVMLAEPPS